MLIKQPKIYFYLPENEQPAGKIPTNIDDYWPWTIGQDVKLKEGKYDWTVQTYIYTWSLKWKGCSVGCKIYLPKIPQIKRVNLAEIGENKN